MAKKSQVPAAPEMTALPMSSGDSPLVIDLPDGQKLIVGNLAAGSVIEVATWRGTGRPDSRTSRLMLGMSSAQDKPVDAVPSGTKKESSSPVTKAVGILRAVAGKVVALLSSAKKNRGEKKNSAPLIEKVTPAARTSEAVEVGDWLNSILEKSAKKEEPLKKAPAKKAATKKAPAKKAATKKSPKKSTARRAR